MGGNRFAFVVRGELGHVDEVFGAGFLDQLGLAAMVDANHSQAHTPASELDAQVTQATTGASDNNPLPRAGVAALQRRVDGDTSAEHGGCLLVGNAVGDRSDVVGRAQGVFLEGARGVIPGDALVEALAIGASVTGLAVRACGRNPLDTDSVADLEAGAFGGWAELGDSSDAFVATDLAGLCREGENFPLVIVSMPANRGLLYGRI